LNNPSSDNKQIIIKLITLRSLVGFLGEKSQFNWWDTNFLSSTGLQFLAINFPRSAFSAGCNSVSEAERIGKGGVYHLFRFPTSIEESIHKQLLDIDSNELITWLNNTEIALEKLKGFVSDSVIAPDGPVQIGTGKNMFSDFAIEELTKYYHNAFSDGKKCFPYFTGN